MKVTAIPIIDKELWTVPTNLEKRIRELEIQVKIETV